MHIADDRLPPLCQRLGSGVYGKIRRVLRGASNCGGIKAHMKDTEHWTELCRQAAVEQDPRKLLQLVTEINRLLAEKQDRLGRVPQPEDRQEVPGKGDPRA